MTICHEYNNNYDDLGTLYGRYYCMTELVEQLEEQLERLRDDYHKICRVPVITSLDEETRIVSTSMKVIVSL